jgi:hypothetical protein
LRIRKRDDRDMLKGRSRQCGIPRRYLELEEPGMRELSRD